MRSICLLFIYLSVYLSCTNTYTNIYIYTQICTYTYTPALFMLLKQKRLEKTKWNVLENIHIFWTRQLGNDNLQTLLKATACHWTSLPFSSFISKNAKFYFVRPLITELKSKYCCLPVLYTVVVHHPRNNHSVSPYLFSAINEGSWCEVMRRGESFLNLRQYEHKWEIEKRGRIWECWNEIQKNLMVFDHHRAFPPKTDSLVWIKRRRSDFIWCSNSGLVES